MRPQGNGLVELHDSKQKERGFFCIKLVEFLTDGAVTKWEQWHGAFLQASAGECPYSQECPIYDRTVRKRGAVQLALPLQ